ncbi:MAG: hypothetical protein M5U34_22865 [Chloroflexi bacterium]|nr:hypothetical protein [Chloroflexota bacterium]
MANESKGNGRSPYLFLIGALLLGLAAALLIFGSGLWGEQPSVLQQIPVNEGELHRGADSAWQQRLIGGGRQRPQFPFAGFRRRGG